MDPEPAGSPRIVRRSPVTVKKKLCPRCLRPLSRGSRFGGWLIPQDYYCSNCGYKGHAYLESEDQVSNAGEGE